MSGLRDDERLRNLYVSEKAIINNLCATDITVGNDITICGTLNVNEIDTKSGNTVTVSAPCLDVQKITVQGQKISDVTVLKDVKANGVSGGPLNAGAWRIRDLNTEEGDAEGNVSLAANVFTLLPGSYYIHATAPFSSGSIISFPGGEHQIRLFDVTAAGPLIAGTSEQAFFFNQTRSEMSTVVVIAASNSYRIEHRTSISNPVDGAGEATAFASPEVYAQVSIIKFDV